LRAKENRLIFRDSFLLTQVDKQLLKPVLLSDQLKQEIKEFRKNQATKVWKEIEAVSS
jgi:hypothetical protein